MSEYFNITCKGERHKTAQTPCQDYSFSTSEGDISIAVVCDGHGAKPYFRSDKGAMFAAEAVVSCLKQFNESFDASLFQGKKLSFKPFEDLSIEERQSNEYQTFKQLFDSIHMLWKQKIHDDMSRNPFTESELQAIPQTYRNMLEKKAESNWPYGTTLLACLQTNDYWMALQIGDGIVITHDGKDWNTPIPKDKNCHDNITTSMCDSYAAEGFRLYFESNGHFPEAIFLTTDGMEKAFLSTDKQAAYDRAMIDVFREAGKDTFIETMQNVLPDFSRLTSGDDISIACIYNRKKA